MDETVKSALIDAVISVAQNMHGDLHLAEKYGGTVFMKQADVPSSLLGGVYAYKDYVSVEFSQGAGLSDPHGHLEGKGKARRHLKLHGLLDIETKDLSGFLAQAFA